MGKLNLGILVVIFAGLGVGCSPKDLEVTVPVIHADILGAPEGSSHKIQVPITFGGDGVTGLYKFGTSGTTDCNSMTGYLVAPMAGVPFDLDISSLPDGEVALCYVRINENGIKGTRERKTWIKDTSAIQYIELSESDVRLDETNAILNYTISMSAAKTYDVKINWERVDGDAIYGVHHMLASAGQLTIPAGQTSAQVSIPILENTDATGEKYFGLRLSGTDSTRVHVGPDFQVLIYEKDNDGGQASRLEKIIITTYDHCALFANGSVKCWGMNSAGSAGTTNYNVYHAPAAIAGLSTGVTSIAGVYDHMCALMSDQTVRCWGRGTNGQLGNSSSVSSNVIVSPTGLSSVVEIAVMARTSCARKIDGTVWCWGRNNKGQMGDNTIIQKNVPTLVTGLPGPATQISAGWDHICAIVAGQVYCWGDGASGQLGSGGTAVQKTATLVPGLSGVSLVRAVNYGTCAIQSGSVKCWGAVYGVLGPTFGETQLSPVAIVGLNSNVTDIGFDYSNACAVVGGEIQCTSIPRGDLYSTPSQYGEFHLISELGANNIAVHTTGAILCIENSNRDFRCFESPYSTSGQAEVQMDRYTPQEFKALRHDFVKRLVGGVTFSCAQDVEDSLWCWGLGSLPESSTVRASAKPILVKELEGNISDFDVNPWGNNRCAVTKVGAVYCWGTNRYGELGDGTTTDRYAPVPVSGLASGAAQIVVHNYGACARMTDGTVRCWGNNSSGLLGDGTTTDSLVATVVPGLTQVTDITAGGWGTVCAVKSTGAVFCWGTNWGGQVGNGTAGADVLVPTQVAGISSGATKVVTAPWGGNVFCALINNGDVKCWGDNSFGDVGIGNFTSPIATPATVLLPRPATDIYFGPCAKLDDNSIYCWGQDYYGQITTTLSFVAWGISTPVALTSPGLTFSEIMRSGDLSRCAKTTDGKIYCWGLNNYSALGLLDLDATKPMLLNKWMEQ